MPEIGAVVMLRATASVALYLQMVGRALRPSPGKDRAVLLDFVSNCGRHGLPDAPRAWSLDAKPRRQRERTAGPSLRKCSACSALNRAGSHNCTECESDLRTPRERREIELRLEEARRREEEDAIVKMRPRERWAWAGADERRLRLVARLSGYSRGWVWHRLREARDGGARG